jgi:hypothetical protein
MNILRLPRMQRAIASFLLLEVLGQILWPTAVFALSSGPTVPEATSFEPVDTTDMVNLNSGDFVPAQKVATRYRCLTTPAFNQRKKLAGLALAGHSTPAPLREM